MNVAALLGLRVRARLIAFRDRQFLKLSLPEAPVQQGILALIVGLLAGGIIVCFRLLIELLQLGLLPGPSLESYAQASVALRAALLLAATIAIWIVFRLLRRDSRQVGVVHVMEHLGARRTHLPIANAVGQLFGAAAAIVGGFSVGREGPGVHLGSASGSQLGIWLQLPDNGVRVLVGCGCAAAIAASFNTPLAGVIFTMEVVMIEYSIASLAPVIIASVTGTLVTRLAFGDSPAFEVPAVALAGFDDLIYLIALGMIIGLLATGLLKLLELFSATRRNAPPWVRLSAALAGTVALASVVPQIMGVGYEVAESALSGSEESSANSF